MSFGWSAGDIATAVYVLWEIGEALSSSHGSPAQRADANQFLSVFNNAIMAVEKIYGPNLPTTPGSEPPTEDTGVPPPTKTELDSLTELKRLYDKFQDEVLKYVGMNKLPDEKERTFLHRQFQKVMWHFLAEKRIRTLRDDVSAVLLTLQPSLTSRQFQGATLLAKLHHNEHLTNFDDLKNKLRIIHSILLTKFPSTNMPEPGPTTTISRASTLVPGSADDYTGYTTALQQVAPFVTPAVPDSLSASLKRLKVQHGLHSTTKKWLTSLDSSSPQSNILWLYDNPLSIQSSAFIYTALSEIDRPVLSYSCSHLSTANKTGTIPPDARLSYMIYSFLGILLTYLDTHLPTVRQRIDAPAFESLDGSPNSIPLAITLLGNLLDNLPCPCTVIIDNFEHIGKALNSSYLRDFFELFSRRPDRQFASFEGSHKLLVTTPGPWPMLSEMRGAKKLTGLGTREQGIREDGSGGYVFWEEIRDVIEGMKVKDADVDAGKGS